MTTYTLNFANGQEKSYTLICENVISDSFINSKGELRLKLGLIKKETHSAHDVAWTDDSLTSDYIDNLDEIKEFLYSESLKFVDAELVNNYMKSLIS